MCHRGLDNAAYYRLEPSDPSRYVDTTGCGNSLNTADATTLRMIMDSLRYWVSEMGVDGFRFDLAPTLGREDGDFDPFSAFFDVVGQDPVVSQVKLIAEPWDVGRMDSYDIGRFPPLWSEWNGRFRDTVRDWWRSHDRLLPDFATRLCGSADIYDRPDEGRRPSASVNFVTVHDGFTLNDLVSYDRKHNEANTENNRDGTDDNRSWNCGAEGPTGDTDVNALRARQKRAFLVTLLLSAGVPLLLGGDELGRTQRGNNNAYCQDNEITWFDWSAVDEDLLRFTKELIALRRGHPVFRRRRYSDRQGSRGPALVHTVGDRDDGRRLGRPERPQCRVVHRRLNGSRRRRRRHADGRRRLSRVHQRVVGAVDLHCPGQSLGAPVGSSSATASTLRGRSLSRKSLPSGRGHS